MTDTCPNCGETIVSSTIAGPGEATVQPCGCSVAPDQLTNND